MAESGLALDGIDRRALRVGRRVLRASHMAAAWGSDGDRLTGEVSQLPREGERGGAWSSVGGAIVKDVRVGQEQGLGC